MLDAYVKSATAQSYSFRKSHLRFLMGKFNVKSRFFSLSFIHKPFHPGEYHVSSMVMNDEKITMKRKREREKNVETLYMRNEVQIKNIIAIPMYK